MYRRRCRALEGLRVTFSLIASYPGEMTLYCLFWMALGVGAALAACLTTCLTCCLAALPYIVTVILLPLYVWLRAFGLLFVAQFGPDYDVFARSTSSLPAPPQLPV